MPLSQTNARPVDGRSTVVAIGLLVGGLLLLLGACSGDAETTDTAADAPGSTSPGGAVESDREPVAGGSIVYAVGAETDGWNPLINAWAPEGTQIALTVYDPLAAYDADGVARPFLAESIEPAADYTSWTITLREGVTFHNGDPLTAEAVETVLEGHRDSPLTGPAVAPIDSVDVVDPLVAVVNMNMPWAAFPQILTSQTGVVPHPSIIEEGINDEPIGTGPFRFVEWVPDRDFIAERFDDYWQPGLPYLDRIEYRPINEVQTRRASFDAGDLDVLAGGDPTDSREFEARAAEGDDVQYFADRGENEEGFVMLNLDAPPFDDVRVRRALAHATDRAAYNEVVNEGVRTEASGPFVPDNPFAIPACFDTDADPCADYPEHDPDAARALLDEVTAETGQPVRFTLANTPNTFDRQQSEFLRGMWEAVGFEVELSFTEQTQYIVDALAGNYQAVAWRQFGQPDPDSDAQWWYSDSDLNFANLVDDEVDAALDLGRSNPDPGIRHDAYVTLQQRFADLVPYVWFDHNEWSIVAKPWVQDIPSGPLPDGTPSKPFVAGTHRVAQIWIDPELR